MAVDCWAVRLTFDLPQPLGDDDLAWLRQELPDATWQRDGARALVAVSVRAQNAVAALTNAKQIVRRTAVRRGIQLGTLSQADARRVPS